MCFYLRVTFNWALDRCIARFDKVFFWGQTEELWFKMPEQGQNRHAVLYVQEVSGY